MRASGGILSRALHSDRVQAQVLLLLCDNRLTDLTGGFILGLFLLPLLEENPKFLRDWVTFPDVSEGLQLWASDPGHPKWVGGFMSLLVCARKSCGLVSLQLNGGIFPFALT